MADNSAFIWVIFLSLLGLIITIVVTQNRASRKRARLQFMELDFLEELDGFAFEDYVVSQLRYVGLRVTPTKKSGDFGVDMVVSGSREYGVQLKHYLVSSVGVSAVQQAYSGANYYNNTPVVFTTGYFSGPAVKLAVKLGVELIDQTDIKNWHYANYSRKYSHVNKGLYEDVRAKLIKKMNEHETA